MGVCVSRSKQTSTRSRGSHRCARAPKGSTPQQERECPLPRARACRARDFVQLHMQTILVAPTRRARATHGGSAPGGVRAHRALFARDSPHALRPTSPRSERLFWGSPVCDAREITWITRRARKSRPAASAAATARWAGRRGGRGGRGHLPCAGPGRSAERRHQPAAGHCPRAGLPAVCASAASPPPGPRLGPARLRLRASPPPPAAPPVPPVGQLECGDTRAPSQPRPPSAAPPPPPPPRAPAQATPGPTGAVPLPSAHLGPCLQPPPSPQQQQQQQPAVGSARAAGPGTMGFPERYALKTPAIDVSRLPRAINPVLIWVVRMFLTLVMCALSLAVLVVSCLVVKVCIFPLRLFFANVRLQATSPTPTPTSHVM